VLEYSLDGLWKAAPVSDGDRGQMIGLEADDGDWPTIEVPGHWATQDAAVSTTGSGPLLHRRSFSLDAPEPGNRRWVEFDGIYYQADVWLDGAYLGDPEGYFVPHAFDVTALSRLSDDHVLAVEVTSPVNGDGPRRIIDGLYGDTTGPVTAHPGGIWRPVRIVDTGSVRVDALRVLCRDADAERAHLVIHARLDSDAGRVAITRTTVDGELVAEHPIALASGANEASWTVDIAHPRLWWPRDLGSADLVDVEVTVEVDGIESHRSTRRTGLRQVRWDDWVCSINGERMFLKGANLLPVSELPGDATEHQIDDLVSDAVECGLDVLRVHGHIADERLYSAADESGLLIMQDFPLRGVHARGVRRSAHRQARSMVDLLGHHPSIVSWWAHDEPSNRSTDGSDDGAEVDLPRRLRSIVTRAGRFARQQAPTWNRSVLDPGVRRVIEQADPTRRCVAHSGVLPHFPLLDGTDSHVYLGWADGPIDDLARESARFPRLFRFVSEFGAPSAPRSGAAADVLASGSWPETDWERFTELTGIDRRHLDDQVPPAQFTTLEEWRRATELHQAEVARRWIEHLRRIAYQPTGGFCIRALNDSNALSTWGAFDHTGQPRPMATSLREICSPVIVVIDRMPAAIAPGTRLSLAVHVVSDLRESLPAAEVEVRVSGPDLDQVQRFAGEIPADSCTRVGQVVFAVPERWGDVIVTADVRSGDHQATYSDRAAIDVPLN
jgi:beta-mannosidase